MTITYALMAVIISFQVFADIEQTGAGLTVLRVVSSSIEEAEKINPLPMYRHQQGVILYALKKYDEAYNAYASLFNSELRDASLFYEASRCKEMLHDSTAVLELLDSCVAMFERFRSL